MYNTIGDLFESMAKEAECEVRNFITLFSQCDADMQHMVLKETSFTGEVTDATLYDHFYTIFLLFDSDMAKLSDVMLDSLQPHGLAH